MPVTLRPISRRRFLTGSLAAAASVALLGKSRLSFAQERKIDPDRFAFLSDTHIHASADTVSRNVNMTEHLRAAVRQVLTAGEGQLPAQVLINGDLAQTTGETGDYANLVALLQPISAAGVPVTMSMGNHDHRERFWNALKLDAKIEAIEQRHVAVVKSPRVDLIILDTLDQTNVTPGVLGEAQLAWLKRTLEASGEKPVMVFMHHNPEPPRPYTTQPAKAIGLTDTQPLLDLLVPRRNVKSLFTGHLHRWSQDQMDGLHLVSLPAVAYVFNAKEPSGWIDCQVTDRGATLSLRTISPDDARDSQRVELAWRA